MSGLIDFKCPYCDGIIEFDSSIQQMKCPYCDSTFDVQALKDMDEILKNAPEDDLNWQDNSNNQWSNSELKGILIYSCESCGGEVIGDDTMGSTSCPYCGSNIVMVGQFAGDLKPDYVIPFKLNKESAKNALNNHLKGKKFLPKVFKDQNHIDEIKGVYVPYWIFNCTADADIIYDAKTIRMWSDSNYNYTETAKYMVNRSGTVDFEKIPVDGSTKMADNLMESIEPFDWKEAVDFQTAYLAGYLAERYDVELEKSKQRANERVKESIKETFIKTVTGYNSVMPTNTSVRIIDGIANYALYPVWILNTSWNGEHYIFAMNGQTGKFVGDLPLDKNAYFRWIIMNGFIIGLIICIILYFIGGRV